MCVFCSFKVCFFSFGWKMNAKLKTPNLWNYIFDRSLRSHLRMDPLHVLCYLTNFDAATILGHSLKSSVKSELFMAWNTPFQTEWLIYASLIIGCFTLPVTDKNSATINVGCGKHLFQAYRSLATSITRGWMAMSRRSSFIISWWRPVQRSATL